jgi:hypothetical protein
MVEGPGCKALVMAKLWDAAYAKEYDEKYAERLKTELY